MSRNQPSQFTGASSAPSGRGTRSRSHFPAGSTSQAGPADSSVPTDDASDQRSDVSSDHPPVPGGPSEGPTDPGGNETGTRSQPAELSNAQPESVASTPIDLSDLLSQANRHTDQKFDAFRELLKSQAEVMNRNLGSMLQRGFADQEK